MMERFIVSGVAVKAAKAVLTVTKREDSVVDLAAIFMASFMKKHPEYKFEEFIKKVNENKEIIEQFDMKH